MAFVAMQYAVLCIATREETGEHDQTFYCPGHHCGCSWMRTGSHPCCCRGDQADPERCGFLVRPRLSRQEDGQWRAVQHQRPDGRPQILPFGTQLRVTNERTGKSVVVRI